MPIFLLQDILALYPRMMIHRKNYCGLNVIRIWMILTGLFLLQSNGETSCPDDEGYCDAPGNDYPWKEMQYYIEENQELLQRMYGHSDFKNMYLHKSPIEPRILETVENACPSEIEIVTPFWANNSEGKYLAIVNFHPFEQAVQKETCNKNAIGHCRLGCHCEQSYAWYRLLAYDNTNDCKGIFMDWFQFPSCCSCRCYDYYYSDGENNARNQENFVLHREARGP